MKTDKYYNRPKGCEHKFLAMLAIIVLIVAFSCNKDTFCWNCSIKERYVNSDGIIVNWYKESFVICNETEEEIFYFEKRNAVILDTTRMLGSFIECRIKP